MSKKYGKKMLLLSVIILTILFTWQLKSPYKLTQIPYFCGVLNSIKKMNVPDSYVDSYNKRDIKPNYEMIECCSAVYDKKRKKVSLEFEIYDINDIDIFSLLVNNISLYMKNHDDSYLNDCKVDIILISMGRECITVCNYDKTYNENTNGPAYKFSNCKVTYLGDVKLSSLKNYTWLEIIDFADVFKADDINSLDNLVDLKEIRYREDIFTDDQKDLLLKKHKDLIFTQY